MKCKDCEYYRLPSYELLVDCKFINNSVDHLAHQDNVPPFGRFVHAYCNKDMHPVNYYGSCSIERGRQ